MGHKVEKTEIGAGDHIYTRRAGGAYSHHGIYVGRNKVVHFTREPTLSSSGPSSGSSLNFSASRSKDPSPCPNVPDCGFQKPESGVVLCCLDCFLGHGSLRRYEYGVTPSVFVAKLLGGTCTTAKSDPPEAVIDRALGLLQNGFGKYDLFKKNCEDFALHCKTGLLIPDQAALGTSGQATGVIGASMAVLLPYTIKLLLSSPVGVATATAGMYCISRYATDIGVRTDVAKVNVENRADVAKVNLENRPLFHGCLDLKRNSLKTMNAVKDSLKIIK